MAGVRPLVPVCNTQPNLRVKDCLGKFCFVMEIFSFRNIQGDPKKKRAPTLIKPRFLVFSPNEMKLWS